MERTNHQQLQQFHEYVVTEEERYEIEDYLQGMTTGNSNQRDNQNNNDNSDSVEPSDSMMKKMKKEHVQWRRKICEWMYNGECCVVPRMDRMCTRVSFTSFPMTLSFVQYPLFMIIPLTFSRFASTLLVVDEFDLDREIVSIGMNYVDRFYSSNSSIIISLLDDDTTSSDFRDHIQLLSMAALWLALKLKDGRVMIIPDSESTMHTLLKLGRDKFSQQQLVKMEVQLLQHLRWLVHPPTPQFYIAYFFSQYTPTQETQETIDEWKDLAIYYVELTTLDYYFVPVKSSLLAFTALVNAASRMSIMGSSVGSKLRRYVCYKQF